MQVTKLRLKEVTEPEFQLELGYVANLAAQRQKEVKMNTRLNFTQIKCVSLT